MMTRSFTWLMDGPQRLGLSLRAWALLVLVSIATLSPGLTSIPVMDRDEARYSQAAVQMMESGDYVDIRFQDTARHVKPAGFYWLEVIAAQPFGGADADIFAFRLPSLVAAILAVLVTAFLGARLFGAPAGLVAGLLLAASLMLQVEARTAKTDAVLLLCAVLAQTGLLMALLRPIEDKAARFWSWPALFWAASGAAIMVKGPIIAMVSVLTLAGYAIVRRRNPLPLLKAIRPLPGLVLMAAIALPWLIAINMATDGAFLRESVGHALFGKVGTADDSHGGPWGYHTMLLPLTFWPGSALLMLAGLAAWKERQMPAVQLLLFWLLPTWLVFELVQTKLPHYVLPVMPALALLTGLGVTRLTQYGLGLKSRIAHAIFVLLAGLAGLAVAVLPLFAALQFGDPDRISAVLAIAFGVLAAASLVWLALKPDAGRVLLTGVLAAGMYTAAFGFAIPAVDHAWPSDRANDLVNTLSGCETFPAATAGYREPSNVFHFGTQTLLTDGAGAAGHLAAHPDCGIAIVDASERTAFDAALGGEPVRGLGAVSGINMVKGDELELEILTLADSQVQAPPAD